MHNHLGHLPQRQQDELELVTRLLMTEFTATTERSGQSWRRNGKILKIILFGSYARDDWVDAPESGYQSDFDLLIVVSHKDLTEIADYWYVAEDKILHDPSIDRLVNIIVHTMDEVNSGLVRGKQFWGDIARDGIVLYELPGHPFATPRPISPRDAYEMAKRYCAKWLDKVDSALSLVPTLIEKDTEASRNDAAFLIHQAAERAYTCFLLVHTLYVPRSHNIKLLRSLVEDRDKRLIEVWPRAKRRDRRRFELLKRAYVEARYSDNYGIDVEDLLVLEKCVKRLRNLIEQVCQEHVERLREAADS